MQKRKHQKRNKFIVFNVLVIVLCGIVLGSFWSYIERTEHLTRYFVCSNSNESYHTDETSFVSVNQEEEHFHGFEDFLHVDAKYLYPEDSIKVNNPVCDFTVNVTKAWLQNLICISLVPSMTLRLPITACRILRTGIFR